MWKNGTIALINK